MKIEPFKMKVTPEQSKKVQKILFAHGCYWYGHLKVVQCETEPYLYLNSDKEISFGTTEEYFKRQKDIKELTYEEFIELYDFELPEKWYVRLTPENTEVINEWKQKINPFSEPAGAFGNKFVTYKGFNTAYKSYYTEITFEQFKKYILKEEPMKKKIIGYRLAKPEYKKAASIIAVDCLCDFSKTFLINTKPVEFWKKSKVLDLWFEPVYEEVEVTLPFGKDLVVIHKDSVNIDGVNVDFYYISKLLNILSSLPSIGIHTPDLHVDSVITVGCKSGTLKEIVAIYNKMKELRKCQN